jgi:hypothetical protein
MRSSALAIAHRSFIPLGLLASPPLDDDGAPTFAAATATATAAGGKGVSQDTHLTASSLLRTRQASHFFPGIPALACAHMSTGFPAPLLLLLLLAAPAVVVVAVEEVDAADVLVRPPVELTFF